MTVFVDDARIKATVGRITSKWCHLFADTEQELHDFAQSIGLKRSWFQRGKAVHGRHWHYDVTEGKRRQAIAAGAVEVTSRQAIHIMNARDAGPVPVPLLGQTEIFEFMDLTAPERAS